MSLLRLRLERGGDTRVSAFLRGREDGRSDGSVEVLSVNEGGCCGRVRLRVDVDIIVVVVGCRILYVDVRGGSLYM